MHLVWSAFLCLLVFVPEPLQAQVLSVVISEVMYKPDPAVGLPEAEYVELYNRTENDIRLKDWKLLVGKTQKVLPEAVLPAHSCLLLLSRADTAAFASSGIPVLALSSLSLNNASQTLTLADASGNTVFTFTYRHEWQEAAKQTGGWSLEMRNTDCPCQEKGNWSSSADASGGTPGRVNPIPENRPDVQPPRLLRVVNTDSADVTLFFTEKLHPQSVRDAASYLCDGSAAAGFLSLSADWTSVRLRLRHPLEYRRIYRMEVLPPLCDCAGNKVEGGSVDFARAEGTDSFDLVINEVLSHPRAGGLPFVEVYNRSDKVLDLKDLRLSTRKSDGSLDTGKRVAPEGWQLFPGTYAFLCRDVESVCGQYVCAEDRGIPMDAFPAYAQGQGRVVLLDRSRVIDEFAYAESMHYPLLVSTEGVSLERLHPDVSTQDVSHWCSAASVSGYATPGLPNSAYSDFRPGEAEELQVENSIFSPDGDGYEDVLKVYYSLPVPECRASAWICRLDGTKVRALLENELLAVQGMFSWDGVLGNGNAAPMGAYLLVFEYYTPDGKRMRLRRAVTVAHRW